MVATFVVPSLGLESALVCASLGGRAYEFSVVDPFWPRCGGISRKRFWFPAHCAFELALIVSLIAVWSLPDVLLIALAAHAAMRIWSAFDLIPKALAFERTDPAMIDEAAARSWVRRSLLRLPLDIMTCTAMLLAFATAARLVP